MTDLSQLMQLSQKLQARMAELQENLESTSVSASSGGGMVTVTVDGRGHAKRVQIDPTCVDSRDVEMLEDLVLAAINQGQQKAQEMMNQEMGQLTGGLQIPGLGM